MKSGACELQVNGDFDPEKKLQWKMFIENKCQAIQVLEGIFFLYCWNYISKLGSLQLLKSKENSLMISKVAEK